MDDITILRQINAQTEGAVALLLRPQNAIRVRWDTNTDTPLPPDFPAGQNPPDGAVINYVLGPATTGVVTLEIRTEAGQVVRRYSSSDPPPPIDPMLAIPAYWVRPDEGLSGKPGIHRFLWDLHYQPVPGVKPSYPIAAVYQDTPPEPTSPWAMPGRYTVVLTANGISSTQSLNVSMDPRVKAPLAELAQQFKYSKELYDKWVSLTTATARISALRGRLTELRGKTKEDGLRSQIDALNEKLQLLAGGGENRRPDPASSLNLASALARVRTLFNILQEVDVAPTPQAATAIADVEKDTRSLTERWEVIRSADVPALNQKLKAGGLPAIDTPP
jgi:hypothetical protein